MIGVMKGRLATLGINLFMAKWVEKSLCGGVPKLEIEKDLSIRRVVYAAYEDQNAIG